ncbi:DUF3093 domain-containing protein [Actinotalea sp.]|uniref:DUF3093 domain-containing protein n=1 Tax=Actinotalea sp. TaxID=1872145 RepID=UPI003568469B
MEQPVTFSERLWPGPLGWASVVTFAAVLAVAMAPVRTWLAVAVGIGALTVGVIGAVGVAARVQVADGVLSAGRARIPVRLLGVGTALDRDGVRRAVGPGSDARDYVLLRSWLRGAVSIPVVDPEDPTPRWIVSTRRPEALLAALAAERQAAHSEQIG